MTRSPTTLYELPLQRYLEGVRGASSTRDPLRGQTAFPASLDVTRPARHAREHPLRKDDRFSIPSYIEDHSVVHAQDGNHGDDSQLRLSDADLEFIRANPGLWLGIRSFGVKRQMRAIEGQRNLTATPGSGRNTDQLRGYGSPVSQETTASGSITPPPICRDHGLCKGKVWGPHAIHICQFDTT